MARSSQLERRGLVRVGMWVYLSERGHVVLRGLTVAASFFWFASRALSRWLPRAMSRLSVDLLILCCGVVRIGWSLDAN